MSLLCRYALWSRKCRKIRRDERYQRRLERMVHISTVPSSRTRGLVVTCCFSGKPDPQRPHAATVDWGKYMSPWWTTVNKCRLQGVVLHNGLPEEFLQRLTTEHVQFQRVEPGDWPLLHDRHRLVRQLLETVPDPLVLVTDCSDVAFHRDPFEMMDSCADRQPLFFGSETKTISRNRSMCNEMTKQFGRVCHGDEMVMNAGIMGGRRRELIQFLDEFVAMISENPKCLAGTDMSAFNRTVYERVGRDSFFTGYPLHTKFRKWEYKSDAAVMHK